MASSGGKRKRNYAQEYQDRIRRGIERGFSKSQAAGHPKPNEPKISEARSLWRRLLDRLVGPKKPPTRHGPPILRPPEPPVPPPVHGPDVLAPEDIFEPVPPEESGIPPDEGYYDSTYDHLRRNMGIMFDEFASRLLWTGWFDRNATFEQRVAARRTFLDYMGLAEYEFDWDSWRDWYSDSAAA